MFAMATRHYIKGCREEADLRPAHGKTIAQLFSRKHFQKAASLCSARGKQGWKETLRLPSRQGKRLSHVHTHKRIHIPHRKADTSWASLFSWKVLADLMRGKFEAQGLKSTIAGEEVT